MDGLEDFGVVEPDTARLLAFACNVCVCIHRVLEGGDHRPCGTFFCVDGPGGWDEPMKLCACHYPAFELSRFPQ